MSEKKECISCVNYNNGFCGQWKSKIFDSKTAESCKHYNTEKKLNKGMQIRQKKLNRKARKRAKIKPSQQGKVCFVEYSEKIIEKINGKYRRPTNSRKGNGLQIENKIFLNNGKYKLINRSSLAITKRYSDIPDWANKKLVDMYYQACSGKEVKTPARKRCNTCQHFTYSALELSYRCEITGEVAKDYRQLKHCMAPMYKRKVSQ